VLFEDKNAENVLVLSRGSAAVSAGMAATVDGVGEIRARYRVCRLLFSAKDASKGIVFVVFGHSDGASKEQAKNSDIREALFQNQFHRFEMTSRGKDIVEKNDRFRRRGSEVLIYGVVL